MSDAEAARYDSTMVTHTVVARAMDRPTELLPDVTRDNPRVQVDSAT